LDAQYDVGRRLELSEFEIKANFIKLPQPPISGWYLQTIRNDPAWFQSRRDLLRRVRDHVVITRE